MKLNLNNTLLILGVRPKNYGLNIPKHFSIFLIVLAPMWVNFIRYLHIEQGILGVWNIITCVHA